MTENWRYFGDILRYFGIFDGYFRQVWNFSNSQLLIEENATLRWFWDSDLHFTETWPRTASFTTMLTVGPSPGGSTLSNVSFTGGGVLDGMG